MNADDRDLRARFAQLREEDRTGVPAFRAPQPEKAPQRWSVSRVAAVAAVILIALVLAWPNQRPPAVARQGVDLSVVAWRSPTDFLLITPGSELLRRVPAVGSPDDWTPIDLPGRSPAPESTRSKRTPS